MLINTFLDTEDFVHLYYPEDEAGAPAQGCGAGARMASKYPPRPPSPEYSQVSTSASAMNERERYRAPPPPEPPPHRVRAADLYPRVRTHYDEPNVDAGFTPICGEFIQWVGRMADGGSIAVSNYRLHIQPKRCNGPGPSVPLRLIDAVDTRDLTHLIIQCKHGRQFKATFSTGDQCTEWGRRINSSLAPLGSVQETFAAAYAAWAKEQPPSSVHRALMRASHETQRHWFGPEVERLGFTSKGAWRVSVANADYKLCPSYPPLLVVPASIGDEDLDSVARFRAMRRIPAVVWRHRGNGAVIARSSQPEVGWLGWRSSEDERLLAAFVSACNADRGLQPHNTNKQVKLLIVDARSYASAVTNRARGGGCECQQYYPGADIQFMSLPNIHHVRRSFLQMRTLAAEPSDLTSWYSNLERTLWPAYVSGVLRAAVGVARAVLAARPVLVHCSDGWDRTPQLAATGQLLLDPHYRTVEGFRVLVEREWLDFGHKFADRCGHQFGPEEPNERSPVFLQWLDAVYQLMLQYPTSFQFNEAYLIKLATHVHSCMFGTFLCNTARERAEARVADCTAHVWHLLQAPAYRNHLYTPYSDQVLWPECSVRSMRVWSALFAGERDERDRAPHAPCAPPGPMTKTRSCDNLLNEAEKRTTQRRCSDPSLAPDVMKLELSVVGSCRRSALTDSCVDTLPAIITPSTEQVDGLHPDHFENSSHLPRDIASGSSSLERELAPNDSVDQALDEEQSSEDQLDSSAASTSVLKDDSPEVEVDGETPEENPVFLGDAYTDVIGMADAAREIGRSRNVSITWRSISESSNQSSTGFELPDGQREQDPCPSSPGDSHDLRDPRDNRDPHDSRNSTAAGRLHTQPLNGVEEIDSIAANNIIDELGSNFQDVDLNGAMSSSSGSSESGARRHPSQLTLCPASPRAHHPRHHQHNHNHHATCVETVGDSAELDTISCWCESEASRRARCVCGAGGAPPAADPLDGLPPAPDVLQARLHHLILHHKKVVEELTCQLREARAALRRASPHPGPALPAPPPHHSDLNKKGGSASGGASHNASSNASSGATSGASSGASSGSEVEVGEDARRVVWLPDEAAPRCQHCRSHFWLARRRHHCRRCGGIFCGSCSELSPWAGVPVRVCRRCRAR